MSMCTHTKQKNFSHTLCVCQVTLVCVYLKSHRACEWVTAHMWKSHVTYTNESYMNEYTHTHTTAWLKSYFVCVSCHTLCVCQVTLVCVSSHACVCITRVTLCVYSSSHIFYAWHTSLISVCVSSQFIHICVCVKSIHSCLCVCQVNSFMSVCVSSHTYVCITQVTPCVWMNICTHTHTCTRIHTYTHTHTHKNNSSHTRVCIQACVLWLIYAVR